jgi:glutamate carboxypeptidase
MPASPPDPADGVLLASAARVARNAGEITEQLVAVSSPSGHHEGFERCVALLRPWLPAAATVERIPCSTTGSPADLLIRLRGTGAARVVLLGHLDTVVPHDQHRPLERDGDRWAGSGSFDMKGGDAIAVGLLRAVADDPAALAAVDEVALLLVADEEWRTEPFVHGERFAGWDACLCFEGGERTEAGEEAVVVQRKAAAAIRLRATGLAAHAGAKPDDGRNALLALSTLALRLAGHHDPTGPGRVSAVPTIVRSGAALNVVPDEGELICDVRADETSALEAVLADMPADVDGVAIDADFGRLWPGMDHREQAAPVLVRAGGLLGRPIHAARRGGASDASHLAPWVHVAIDGLGPLGGGAHARHEHIDGGTLEDRAAVALAVLQAVLRPA